MSNDEKRVWGIHTTDDSLFLHNNIIAIGWKEFGDCSSIEPTREAFKECSQVLDATPIIRGIDGTELVDLILKYYDQLSDKYKKMIPLKMVYIPIQVQE